MEGEVVRRKCALRLRDHFPFRRLRRKHYDVLTAPSSRGHASIAQQPVSKQVIPEPHLLVGSVPSLGQSESPTEIHMEQDRDQEPDPGQDLKVWAEDRMDVDGTIDPETGELRTEGP